MQRLDMATDANITWTGTGKWLAFTAAALLILFAIPPIFDNTTGAAAGWNIFLGLFLFGAVASGNARAPQVAATITVLMAVKLIATMAFGGTLLDIGVGAALLLVVGLAAWTLRKQTKTI